MDFTVSNNTLDCLEEVIYEINLELLHEVHQKFLSDLDFEELESILKNKPKKKFIVKKKQVKGKTNTSKKG